MAFGISFTPGQNGDNGERDQRAPSEAMQRAIQILSLRLPRVMGGSALAPAQLLQGQGAIGSPFGRSGLNPMLQALLQMAGMGGQAGPMAQGPMAPRIIPGIVSSDPAVVQAKQTNMADYYNSQPDGLAGAQTDFAQTSPYGPGSGHPKYGLSGPPPPVMQPSLLDRRRSKYEVPTADFPRRSNVF